MTTHNDQLFQLLSDFKTWQDGDALSEQRLVQHDLVLAHLARLYGGLSWNAQHFGLLPSYSQPIIDIQKEGPVALSHLLAVTATGKLLVCAKATIPHCDNPNENKGLFAIAQPLKLPEAMQKTWPDFPLYQIQLKWQAWQSGIDDIVKTGEGLPLGRLKDGQWNAQYIPPVVSVSTNENLQARVKKIMANVVELKNADVQIQALVLEINCKNDATTPLDFWITHCRCLIMLQTHRKMFSDKDYKDKVSELESGFMPWDLGASLDKLEACWNQVKLLNQTNSVEQKRCIRL